MYHAYMTPFSKPARLPGAPVSDIQVSASGPCIFASLACAAHAEDAGCICRLSASSAYSSYRFWRADAGNANGGLLHKIAYCPDLLEGGGGRGGGNVGSWKFVVPQCLRYTVQQWALMRYTGKASKGSGRMQPNMNSHKTHQR